MIERLRGTPAVALVLGGAVLVLVLAAIAVAVFGGGGEEGPAELAPEDAAAYFEASVRPEGEAREGAEAALSTVLDSDDPGGEIISLIEREAAQEGEEVDWEEDIAPWLGERIGIFPASLAGESEAVVVVETTDPDASLEFLRSREDATGEEGDYKGHSYELDSEGDAFGAVDDFLVFGPPEGFERAVDAADSDSLADSDSYQDAVDELPGERLATLYAIPNTFLEAIPEDEIDPTGRSFLRQALGDAGEEPVLGGITASGDDVTLELRAGGSGPRTEESSLLAALPAEAWLGVGLANLGGAVRSGVESVESIGIPGLSGEVIREQLRAQSGIDLDQEVIGPLGDVAFFLRGTTEASLGGALVIETKDPEASAALLAKLQRLISQRVSRAQVRLQPLASTGGDVGFQLVVPGGELKQPIQVVQRGNRIVAGYGRASVSEALTTETGGAGRLSGSESFGRAQGELEGLGVDLFLSVRPALDLAESLGADSDPDYRQAKPFLDGLDFLALGTGPEGDDRTALRLVLGLR